MVLRIGNLAILGVSLSVAACGYYDTYPVLEEPATPVGGFLAGPPPAVRFSYASVSMPDDEVLVSGGIASDALPWTATSTVATLSPLDEEWKTRPVMSSARYGHQTVLLDDSKIFIVGGQTNASMPCQTIESCSNQPYLSNSGIFQLTCPVDSMTCHWNEMSEMAFARTDFVALALGQEGHKKVLVSGGRADEVPLHAELFDVSTNQWTTLADTNNPIRLFHAGVVLPDGSALLIGGLDPNQKPIASADHFDIVTNSWLPSADLNEPRYLHTATSLGDGRVLVTGGTQNGKDGVLASTEFYDESTNEWTVGPPMNEKRYGHAAALLIGNRRVLVVGGRGEVNGVSQLLESAEILDLQTNTWTKIESPLAQHWLPKIHVFPNDGRALVIGSAEIIGDQITHLPTTALYTAPCTSHFDCPPAYACSVNRVCLVIVKDDHSN